MKRISWVHIFLGRQEQPTELSLYVCPEEDPWYIDGILDVRLPAYRDDGPTLDRAVDPEIRGLVLDDVQESVEQNAESVESARGWDDYTFERFCEEFGCTPMDVYHVRTRSSGTAPSVTSRSPSALTRSAPMQSTRGCGSWPWNTSD